MPDKYGQPIKASERETQKALKLPRGKPDEWDGRPVSIFPGKPRKPIPGQLATDEER